MPTTIADLVRSGYEQWNDASALAELGRELEERTRFEVARLFLERSIELDPTGNPYAYINLAFTYFRDNVSHVSVGLGIMERGIEATNSDLVRTMYVSYLPDDRQDEGVAMLRSISKSLKGVHPVTVASVVSYAISPEEALEIVGDVKQMEQALMSGGNVDVLSDFATLCTRLSTQGKLDLSTIDLEALLDKIASLCPERIKSHSAPTFCYTVLQQWQDLERASLRALEGIPDDESMMLNVGIAAENMGDILKAEQWYQRAIGAKLSFAGARIRLARMWEKDGQLERALNMVREMLDANPGYAFGYVQAANMFFKNGYIEEAKEYMSIAKPRLSPWMIESINRNEQAKTLYESVP